MRTVALEEHFTIPELVKRIPKEAIRARGYPPQEEMPETTAGPQSTLPEIGEKRLAEMDAAGISVQVLSLSGPGADILPPAEGIPWAREANDHLAAAIAGHPARFAGFAHLPMTAPEAAGDELERCIRKLHFVGALINGTTQEKFLDDPMFEPLLARAEALDVPLYLHPGVPPAAVRDAYYSGLPHRMNFSLSIAAFGWHAETAVHILRLVFSGTLDRHPRLKLIIGHMGEFLPMTLARTTVMTAPETSKYLRRNLAETLLDQLYITTSGQFTTPPMSALLQTFGLDRILFSVDYPFSPSQKGRDFLDRLPLAPADIEKISHGNADRLLKLPAQTAA